MKVKLKRFDTRTDTNNRTAIFNSAINCPIRDISSDIGIYSQVKIGIQIIFSPPKLMGE